MSGLAFAEAPPPSRPLRFLLTALAWGAIAGLWLLAWGPRLLLSRWAPPTLAWVHLFALGVLGNAMIGALLQFLPVAAGSRVRGAGAAPWLHAGFNIGIVLLIAALLWPHPLLTASAMTVLGGALLAVACAGLHAVVRGVGARMPRFGIGLALSSLLATAMLGSVLLLRLSGHGGWSPARPTNLHAAFGLGGWVLGLLAAVGSVTLPMLQGTRPIPDRALRSWLCLLALALAGLVFALIFDVPARIYVGAWLPAGVFAIGVLALLWRSPRPRNPGLRTFWSGGCVALALATVIAVSGARPFATEPIVMAGVLTLAIGLPWLVIGMLLEILGFLAWIALRRRHPRGVRVPGVDRLYGEADKRRLQVLHGLAAIALIAALALPALARPAGALLALAYAATLLHALRGWRRASAFTPA